jgi:poly(3-hydroxybutyrate) depolymerase
MKKCPLWPDLVVAAALLLGAAASAADLPVAQTHEQEFLERRTVRYDHDCLEQGGPVLTKRQYFYVMLPRNKKDAPAPLIIYLHSAGGNAETELKVGGDFVVKAGSEFMGLLPNSPVGGVEGWWGAHALKADKGKYGQQMTPTEQRVLATIEWVVRKHNVDRNRIYLCGISMGGSGALGIGMCHGDVFASIWTGVPAGARHVMERMHFPESVPATASPSIRETYLRAVSGQGLPDAPPILNFSSHTDDWSRDQPGFLRAAHDGRHALVFAWGPWGHSNSYAKTNRAAYEFPWLQIRKNEAYPVFTDASTDQKYPGCKPPQPDPEGQINAFGRWTNITDTPEEFAMELRLVDKAELSAPISLPEEVRADVSLRRLQKFKVQVGKTYAWTFGSNRSGDVQPNPAGLLTFPRLVIFAKPTRLTLKPK